MDVGAVAVRHDPASAAFVRQAIARDLESAALSRDSIDDVVLVASELVGNAVVHTAGAPEPHDDLDIGWQIDGGHVLVWVGDTSPTVPQLRTPDTLATSGRGLAIVAAVAAEWGVEAVGTGKRVWARVPICAAA